MTAHLPALQVVLPLVAAPICVLLRHARLTWAFATAVAWAATAIAWTLLRTVVTTGPWVYEMGGWSPPYGISYRIDPVSAWVLCIVATLSAVVLTWLPASVKDEIPEDRHYLFYAAWLLCTTGLLGIAATRDAFNVFVFLEISSLASYALISLGRSRRALTAAYQYLIMGSLGGTFILIGIGLMYQMTGTLHMDDLAVRLQPVLDTRTVLVSFAFVTVGASLKLALWPLHVWLPNAYAYAPSSVSAFISATSTKVMVYVLLRFVFDVYGADFAFGTLDLGLPLMALALAGIYVASTVAVFQIDVKRLLAYSSVAQIGYMILGISLGTPAGVASALLHLFNHALMKGGLFLVLGQVFLRTGSVDLDDLRGLGRVMPVTMAGFVVGGLGLVGVPLTVGFTSKWVLLGALVADGLWPVAILALASSLLALAYVWKVVEVAYLHPPSEAHAGLRDVPWTMQLPTWVLLGATLVLGAWGAGTTDLAMRAATALLEGAP